MEFTDFYNKVGEDMQLYLDDTHPGATVKGFFAQKLQEDGYHALSVSFAGNPVAVSINMDAAFELYKKQGSYHEAKAGVLAQLENAFEQMPNIHVDVDAFRSWDTAKGLLYVSVVGDNANREFLENAPHIDILDMSVVARLDLGSSSVGSQSVIVSEKLLDHFGVSKEELFKAALENSQKIRPVTATSLAGAIGQAIIVSKGSAEEEPLVPLTVVTNEFTQNGAVAALYPGFMEKMAEQLGESFYVFPSSIHELLLLPEEAGTAAGLQGMKDLVASINAETVLPEDKLTDNVYHFDAEKKVFEFADTYEARLQDKTIPAIDAREALYSAKTQPLLPAKIENFFSLNIVPAYTEKIVFCKLDDPLLQRLFRNADKHVGPSMDGREPLHYFNDPQYRCMYIASKSGKFEFPEDSSYLFSECTRLRAIEGLDRVDTSHVVSMKRMFAECTSLENLDLSHWDTSNVSDMSGMFCRCGSLKQVRSADLNTSGVTDMSQMFAGCSALRNPEVKDWNTVSLEDSNFMFAECTSVDALDLSGWNTENLSNAAGMFARCERLSHVDLSTWTTGSLKNADAAFASCDSLMEVKLPKNPLAGTELKNAAKLQFLALRGRSDKDFSSR